MYYLCIMFCYEKLTLFSHQNILIKYYFSRLINLLFCWCLESFNHILLCNKFLIVSHLENLFIIFWSLFLAPKMIHLLKKTPLQWKQQPNPLSMERPQLRLLRRVLMTPMTARKKRSPRSVPPCILPSEFHFQSDLTNPINLNNGVLKSSLANIVNA